MTGSRQTKTAERSDRPRHDKARQDRPKHDRSHDRSEPRADARRSNGNGRAKPTNGKANGKTKSVYIANLPWKFTENDLYDLFGKYGKVHKTTVITDKRSGRSKGFGFVDMPQPAAKAAIADLNGSLLEGRDLTVRFAQPSKYN
ncbi:MAG: hypothetical protein HKN01_07730 [Acidimicrobiia bacterium]|nr:hypothetical protein [Acidimicrobiia bacterium]